MRRARVPLSAVLAAASLIAGCAQFPFTGSSREQGNPDAFEALGRVYVRFGLRAFSGSLRWRHDPQADEVWLGGPLGQTGAHIVRDSAGATLTTADQQTYRAMSIESLTRDGLGWSMPLADLSYYVVGKVPPDSVNGVERDTAGRVVGVERDGWKVQWSIGDAAAAGSSLPRLNLTKDDVEIRLVIDRLDQGQI